MKIRNLIETHYPQVSDREEWSEVIRLLQQFPCLTVIDKDLQPAGIITRKDIRPALQALSDCDLAKPVVNPEQMIAEVFAIMQESMHDFLQVYEDDRFLGVVPLARLTGRLIEVAAEIQRNYQQLIHDIRNPIANIHGLSSLLSGEDDDAERQRLVALCNKSCQHALDILDDLVFIETDENKPLNKVPTEMCSFYAQCIQDQYGLAQRKDIRIETDFTAKEVIRFVDRNLLKRAIQNVVFNAIKFSYPCSIIKVGNKIRGDKLVLKIADAGVGIPPHMQWLIFDKFSPAQRTGTGGEPSTGLGLYYTKQCIERHQGAIYCKSTEGIGTKFYIEL
jgi:signal transduction histidine kinase